MRPSEGRGRKWERDEAGRKYYEQAGAKVFENASDRDGHLADRFIKPPCGEDCCRSMLAYIGAHSQKIVMEYMTWVSSNNYVVDDDSLRRYEVEIFHDRLPPAEHGILSHYVSVARFGDRYDRARKRRGEPKLTPDLTSEERRDRMMTALDELSEKQQMPDGDNVVDLDRARAARAPAGEREEED